MTYKTIVTYLATPERAGPLLDLAQPLAQRCGARLVGLHILPQVLSAYGAVDVQIPADVIERQYQELQQRADRIEAVFSEKARLAGVTAEWRCHDAHHGDIAEDVADQSLCADLIVLGLETGSSPDAWTDVPARIALQTGRPVLAIPNPAEIASLGKHALIAWNTSREAARAAFDAIPLMAEADRVDILAIDPEVRNGHEDLTHGRELATCLRGHGVKADARVTQRQGIPISDVILNRIAEDDCDLLVMGCYGHSRLRESLFGGATRELLQHLRVPILMSH